jgi:ankyrin repeat protein
MVFIKNKANIKRKSINGKTLLHYACTKGATISSLTLINEGADLEAKDEKGNTPFSFAIMNGHEDLCIFLV